MSKLAPNSTVNYVANPTGELILFANSGIIFTSDAFNFLDAHGAGGFYIGGNLPVSQDTGVHSLTDVSLTFFLARSKSIFTDQIFSCS